MLLPVISILPPENAKLKAHKEYKFTDIITGKQ